ncbi:MAG: polysaccharide biosynthesis protein [Anaerolineae bacterium]|nr:polysaccharide biosynthesis protein [Anaerolineae bacterium]MBT7191423.1 polysaccharide biosynthesis protein [Anaerolineae bacterium]MBT7992017.1 polysaccharide biosynthesis protein [Anaerolineae bacterium]
MTKPSRKPRLRNRYVLIGDLLVIVISVMGSFALRLDVGELPFYSPAIWVMAGVALLIKTPTYYFFGLYRRMWIYASVNELKLIAFAVTTASVAASGVMLLLLSAEFIRPGMPRSALGIDWLLSLVLIGGSRFALRILAEQGSVSSNGDGHKALIIGAGDAGALVVREMQRTDKISYRPIGFLDDDAAKQKQEIYGVPIIGRLDDLARVLENHQVDEVIFAIPSLPGKFVREAADTCRKADVPFRTMPGIYELLGGKINVSRLRNVDITDLLRRPPARTNEKLLGASLKGKRVLVTGAGGSIGSELCRQISRWGAEEVILLGHGENSIFEALIELKEDYPTIKFTPVIADIRHADRLERIFAKYQPQIIFHAAAHKHVPLMEARTNIEEAITNNVLGTQRLVDAALGSDIERLVMISTDKAVSPSNVYGATKRLAEMLVLDAAKQKSRAFTVVRFGNVLGSRGSIIPRFKRQISLGGPVTITHPDMERFFMTIPEAVHLVLQAAAMGEGGETFVLNMGEPVSILGLAKDLIRLSGLEPDEDIEIEITGIRPGEKMTEILWEAETSYDQTEHPDIFQLDGDEKLGHAPLFELVRRLDTFSRQGAADAIVSSLDEHVPGAEIKNPR